MTYLVGSASTTRFSSTYAVNSGAGGTSIKLVGNPADTAAVATGTAENLYIYVSSWGSQTNIKCCIYDETLITGLGALLETVIVTSSAGTGVLTIPLAGTTTITSGNKYRLGLYTEDADDITMFSDTGGLTLRKFTSGSYTTPADPSLQSGGFDSFNEFYFALDDVAGATVTPGASNYTYADTITYTTTLTSLTSATLTDAESNVFTLTSVTDTSADIPAIAAALDACLTGPVTLTVSDGSDTATAAITLDPLSGYTVTTLTSLAGTPSWIDDWDTAAEVGDQGQKDEPRLTLNADGSYSTTGDTAFSEVVWVTAKTGGEVTAITYNFLDEGGGGTGSGPISSSIINSSTIDSTTITSTSI